MGKKLVKKIDIHVHAMNYELFEVPRFDGGRYATPKQLLKMYEELGVDKAVLLPEIFPECGWVMQSNEEGMKIVEQYPDTFMWFCNIDPRMGKNSPDTDLGYYMSYYKSKGALGVGEVVYNDNADDAFMDNLFYHAARLDMPVTFHIGPVKGGCYGIVDDLGLPRIEKMLKKHPKLRLFGHSQPFWAEIGDDCNPQNRNSYPSGKIKGEGALVRLMRENKGLFGDLSAGSAFNALSRDPEFGYAFIEEFKEQLLFGTDICDPRNDMELSHWLDKAYLDGNISEEAYYLVSRGNAERELKLKS